MAVKLGKSLILTNILDVIPISFEHDLVKIEAPRAFWDKSLNDLQLRKKYHVNLIGIIQRDETGEEKELINSLPGADTVIREDHNLIIVGKKKDIESLAKLE